MHKRITSTPPGFLEGVLTGVLAKINSQFSGVRADAEIAAEIDRLTRDSVLTHNRFLPGVLKSSDLNVSVEKLFFILHGLYKAFILSDNWQSRQIQSLESDTSVMLRAAARILEDIRVFKLLRLNPKFNDVRLLNFVNGTNRSTGGTSLKIDSRSRILRLTEIDRERHHIDNRESVPSLTVTYLSNGVTGTARKDHGLENAVDSSEETFWLETIYADDPTSSTVGSTTYKGVGVYLILDLRKCSATNRIDLKPFGITPPRLINLEYSTDGINYTAVPGFSEPSVREQWWSFLFSTVSMRYIRCTLLQQNYTEHFFHVPESIIRNQILFDHIADDTTRYNLGSREDSEIEVRNKISDPEISLLLDAIGKIENGISTAPLPGDTSSRILDVNATLSHVLNFLGIKDQPFNQVSDFEDPKDSLVETRKFEYTIGLHHIEASYSRFFPTGKYRSPDFSIAGTLWEVQLSASPTHVSFTDDLGDTFPATTAEFDIEISPSRTKPIYPKELTTDIYEVVPIDPKRKTGKVRFNTTDTDINVWWNGRRLLPTQHYDFDPSTRILSIFNVSYTPGSIYLVGYRPTTGQHTVDVIGSFKSRLVSPPEVFNGTDHQGLITLRTTPFIDYNKINNTDLFYKETDRSRFHFKTSTITSTVGSIPVPIGQRIIDGEIWGIALSNLQLPAQTATGSGGISDSDIVIPIGSTSQFVDPSTTIEGYGILRIEDELIRYSVINNNSFGTVSTPCIRGYAGTTAVIHPGGVEVTSQGKLYYDPLEVRVDGVLATNRTDYYKLEHPAFDRNPGNSLSHSYIQSANRIYFESSIPNTSVVDVSYKVLTDYLALNVTFRQTVPGRMDFTPDLREAILYMNRADL